MYDSLSEKLGEQITPETSVETLQAYADKFGLDKETAPNHGKLVEHLWEHFYTEDPHTLWAPTFVRDFPVETSPLTKSHRSKPGVVEKWDLYVRGFELATAYSELNDPIDQLERFQEQAKLKEKGDDEAMFIDMDFVRALEYGMPPTSGMGIGIDRLVMMMTGAQSIQDVLLFPQMRPEKLI
jgi:lysyl-tRNA synthetase class 2